MPTITVLIAAHNEEDRIGAALESLYGQTRAPDHIVVVDDRSEDGTAQVAESFNCEVLPTVGNTGRKSGALNYGLKRFLAVLDDDDMVLCMDADTQLAPDFLLVAEKRIAQHDVGMAPIGAVGAHLHRGTTIELRAGTAKERVLQVPVRSPPPEGSGRGHIGYRGTVPGACTEGGVQNGATSTMWTP